MPTRGSPRTTPSGCLWTVTAVRAVTDLSAQTLPGPVAPCYPLCLSYEPVSHLVTKPLQFPFLECFVVSFCAASSIVSPLRQFWWLPANPAVSYPLCQMMDMMELTIPHGLQPCRSCDGRLVTGRLHIELPSGQLQGVVYAACHSPAVTPCIVISVSRQHGFSHQCFCALLMSAEQAQRSGRNHSLQHSLLRQPLSASL